MLAGVHGPEAPPTFCRFASNLDLFLLLGCPGPTEAEQQTARPPAQYLAVRVTPYVRGGFGEYLKLEVALLAPYDAYFSCPRFCPQRRTV